MTIKLPEDYWDYFPHNVKWEIKENDKAHSTSLVHSLSS